MGRSGSGGAANSSLEGGWVLAPGPGRLSSLMSAARDEFGSIREAHKVPEGATCLP